MDSAVAKSMLVESTQGLFRIKFWRRYIAMYKRCPQVLKYYVPVVVFTVVACILAIEIRIGYAFAAEDFGK